MAGLTLVRQVAKLSGAIYALVFVNAVIPQPRANALAAHNSSKRSVFFVNAANPPHMNNANPPQRVNRG